MLLCERYSIHPPNITNRGQYTPYVQSNDASALPVCPPLPAPKKTRLTRSRGRLVFNELYERVVDVCYDYVLDSSARSYDWRAVLSGVEPTLRSHVRPVVSDLLLLEHRHSSARPPQMRENVLSRAS